MAAQRKVFWTDREKSQVIRRAIEIQKERPDLAGLRLLREAMMALPVDRRRKVAALTLAPWFEEGIKAAVRRAQAEDEAKETMAAMAWSRNQILEANRRTLAEWRVEHQEWRMEARSFFGQLVHVLDQILAETRALNTTMKKAQPGLTVARTPSSNTSEGPNSAPGGRKAR